LVYSIRINDGNSNTTSYNFDDMGRVYQGTSPDTGATTYGFDATGNLTSKTDAKNITIVYQYDAANRLTKIDYPSDTDITFSYDNCQNGKGRLCSVSDQSGTTAYEYTPKGHTAQETKTILGVNYITNYSYDMNGNVTSIVYPSNRTISYDHANDRVSAIINWE
jgi:YD repeat-containing protein